MHDSVKVGIVAVGDRHGYFAYRFMLLQVYGRSSFDSRFTLLKVRRLNFRVNVVA